MVYSQLLPPQSSSSAMINQPHHHRDTSSVGMGGGGQMLLSPLDEIQHQQPHQYTSTDSPGGLYEGISQSFINTSFKNQEISYKSEESYSLLLEVFSPFLFFECNDLSRAAT